MLGFVRVGKGYERRVKYIGLYPRTTQNVTNDFEYSMTETTQLEDFFFIIVYSNAKIFLFSNRSFVQKNSFELNLKIWQFHMPPR